MAIPFITLNIGGKERRLRFDLNALIELQNKAGIKLSQLGEFLKDIDEDVSKFRLILWAGLRHEDKDLTEEDVGQIDIMALMSKAGEVSNLLTDQLGLKEIEEEAKNESGVEDKTNKKSGAGLKPSTSPTK